MEDLKIIKKYFGEDMMHFCRELFPTILETPLLLSRLLLDSFAPNRFLYNDIIKSKNEEKFKNYIYSKLEKNEDKKVVTQTPKELLESQGYILHECKTEEDIQKFKSYYAEGESLCTFYGKRLDKCYVFFAVKKDVDKINRKDFTNPKREDLYGTSVISIQFTRGIVNTLSIKNRYNHKVENCDATFSNNLENIAVGLTSSFEKYYNLNINSNSEYNFELRGYVRANDGKYYKYNYEINNKYYCPDNIIIDNFEVKHEYSNNKERYIVLDYFILDLQKKEIKLYDQVINDSFIKIIDNIKNIIVKKDDDNKIIEIITDSKKSIIIKIDKTNKIIEYKNDNILKIEDNFMCFNKYLQVLSLNSVVEIGDSFLKDNINLNKVNLNNVVKIGKYCLSQNKDLKILYLTKVVTIGREFLYTNEELSILSMPKVNRIGELSLSSNKNLKELYLPEVTRIEAWVLMGNNTLEKVYLPEVIYLGENFLYSNKSLKKIHIPKLKDIGEDVLKNHPYLKIVKKDKKSGKIQSVSNLEISLTKQLIEKISKTEYEFVVIDERKQKK